MRTYTIKIIVIVILAAWNGKLDIAQYLIIEQNMIIDNDTMGFLIEKEQQEVLEMIKSRELYQKMNSNLSKNKQVTPKMKI